MVVLAFSLLVILQPIEEITFAGNNTFDAAKLMQVISSLPDSGFSRSLLDHDILVLKDYYRKQGFFNTNVIASYQGDSAVIIEFEITEGIRPKISKIYFPPDSAAVFKNTQIRTNDYLIEGKIFGDIAAVEDYFADHGYPYARLSYYTTFSNDTLILFWDLKKGNRYYISNIEINGLKNVPERIVYNNVTIEKGDLFSKKQIVETQKNLYLLFLFRLVDFKYRPSEEDSIDIIINLEETNPLGLNFGFGFMTPYRLLGSITLENLNVLHTGNQLTLPITGWINLKREYKITASLGYKFLYPLKLPISVTFGPFIEKEQSENYGRFAYGVQGIVKRKIFAGLETSLSYRYKKLRWTGIPLAEGVTNSLTSKAILDLRNDILDPQTGLFFLPTIEYGGGVLGGDNNFIRYLIDFRLYHPVPGFTYSWRFRLGEIFELFEGFGTHEKYQLVSSTSLRGYHDYEIGPDVIGTEHYGSFLFGLQMEPRFRIGKFGLVVFLDLGSLTKNSRSFSFNDVEMGTGFGLRYFTPIGPVRLDYGKRIKDPASNDKGMIYFSLQHAF